MVFLAVGGVAVVRLAVVGLAAGAFGSGRVFGTAFPGVAVWGRPLHVGNSPSASAWGFWASWR